MTDQPEPLFDLVYTGQVRATLESLAARAIQEGHALWLARLLRQLEEHLAREPLRFGEPLYRLPHSGLEMRAGGLKGLLLLFGADAEHRCVYLLRCLPPLRLGD